MITEERISAFINSLGSGNSEFVEEVRKSALESHVPIIRRETESLIKVLLHVKQPGEVLEIGTAVGYSALVMSEHLKPHARITTIENYGKRIPIAEGNIRKAGKEEMITLLPGDALEVMKALTTSYDFIFMDAAKGQYLNFLPELLRLLKPGGILVSDNVLQEGDIMESRYLVIRRNRTIHARMREYLYQITHMEGLETSILPVGDGVALSVRV